MPGRSKLILLGSSLNSDSLMSICWMGLPGRTFFGADDFVAPPPKQPASSRAATGSSASGAKRDVRMAQASAFGERGFSGTVRYSGLARPVAQLVTAADP